MSEALVTSEKIALELTKAVADVVLSETKGDSFAKVDALTKTYEYTLHKLDAILHPDVNVTCKVIGESKENE